MKATAMILARVEDHRFQRAMEGVRQGLYHVTITFRSEEEVRGFISTAAGQQYGCTITEAGAFCSCPDALYRGHTCKHAVALALHEIRDSQSGFPTPLREQHPR